MGKHKWGTNNPLVDYAIKQSLGLGLLISLTILWDQAEWTNEGLREFESKYYEWLDAFNNNEEGVLNLVKEMKEATGIEV